MQSDCPNCQKIAVFEQELDKRADTLVEKVNALCKETRQRNKEKLESFAYLVNLPVIGNIIYNVFRAPSGLERDPTYSDSDWYSKEGSFIEKEAHKLEQMKADHIDHCGDELVNPSFWNDFGGSETPNHRITRKECYDIDYCTKKRKQLLGHDVVGGYHYSARLPDKYDFYAGGFRKEEGIFVIDSISKQLVPKNRCNFKGGYPAGIMGKLAVKLARSGTVYTFSKK